MRGCFILLITSVFGHDSLPCYCRILFLSLCEMEIENEEDHSTLYTSKRQQRIIVDSNETIIYFVFVSNKKKINFRIVSWNTQLIYRNFWHLILHLTYEWGFGRAYGKGTILLLNYTQTWVSILHLNGKWERYTSLHSIVITLGATF